MGLPNEVNSALIGAAAAGGYEIEQSLRFESSAYLYRTPSSAGNRNVWTISLWAKRGNLGSQQDMYSAGTGGTDILYWTSSDQIAVDAPALSVLVSNDRFRDPSAWYHIVMAVDATNGTNSNRTRIYVNNREITSWATDGRGSLTSNKYLTNSTERHTLGIRSSNLSSTPYKGYESEFYLIDGQQLTPSDFGEYDNNGVWIPKKYSGTYGTNGVHLKFDSAGIGDDSGTNGHTWSHTGFTTSGTGTDVLSDTPTNNFCTWNPIAKGGSGTYTPSTLSDGNLRHNYVRTYGDYFATANFAFPETGNYYWEVKVTNTSSYFCLIGICEQDWIWNTSPTVRYVSSDGKISNSVDDPQGYPNYTAATYGNGDVIGCAWNGTNKTLQFYKNGTAQASPLSPTVTSGKTFVPCWHAATDNWEVTINCGQRDFEYAAPSGYNRLCTADLPAPAIADGSDYFQTVLYQGNDPTGQNITVADNSGNSWQPDFVWIKARGVSYWHRLYDAVRGATKEYYANENDPENTDTNALTSFNSNGFTLGSDQGVNQNTYNFVSWNWKAGNGTSSITAGSIDGTNPTIASTLSANPTAGFSIVAYSGNNGSNQTVAHGLGVAPDVVILKARNATRNWYVQHKNFTDRTYFGYLNDNGTPYAGPSGNSPFDNGTFNSTVFSVNHTGNSETGNASGENYVAYCFAEVEGYSKFGIYKANGAYSNGPFIYTGFKPAFVLYKVSTAGGNWQLFDNKRGPYNDNGPVLYPDLPQYEDDLTNSLDFLSNGFKLYGYGNDSPQSFVYLAFAEHPFGGEGVSPATAR